LKKHKRRYLERLMVVVNLHILISNKDNIEHQDGIQNIFNP